MRWSEIRPGSVLALLALLLLPVPAPAQTLILEGVVDHPAAELLRDIVARGDFRVLDRDTVLSADTDLPHDVVVLDARVALEGVVRGAVAVVHGTLFLRPGARVAGPVAEISGDFLTSGTATSGERHALPLEVRTTVDPVGGGYRLTLLAPPRPPVLALPRVLGAEVPSFDRVNGFTLGWQVGLNLGRDTTGSRAWAGVRYHTERAAWGGEAGARAPLGRGLWISLVGERGSVTNDAWIRDDLVNSASALVFRSDARDYYHAERAVLTLERRSAQPLLEGEGFVAPRVGVAVSRDRSLPAGDPWTLLDRREPWRPNPPVTEATVVSALVGAALAWRGPALHLSADLGVEWAPPAPGDLAFTYLVAQSDWRMPALWGHAIAVRARTQLPLDRNGAPPQRWSHVGGSGTLPTLQRAALRGDRLVFVDSRYLVPVPRVRLPLAGAPALRLQHVLGVAWHTGTPMPRWEQNLGLGVDFTLLEATLFVDPAAPRRPAWQLGATLPGF